MVDQHGQRTVRHRTGIDYRGRDRTVLKVMYGRTNELFTFSRQTNDNSCIRVASYGQKAAENSFPLVPASE